MILFHTSLHLDRPTNIKTLRQRDLLTWPVNLKEITYTLRIYVFYLHYYLRPWDNVYGRKKEFCSTRSLVFVTGQWELRHLRKYRSLFGCVSSHQRSVSVLCGKRVSSCSQMSVFALVCKVWVEVQDESACQWWDYDTAHIRCLPALRSVFISWIRVDAASVECRVQESRRLI